MGSGLTYRATLAMTTRYEVGDRARSSSADVKVPVLLSGRCWQGLFQDPLGRTLWLVASSPC